MQEIEMLARALGKILAKILGTESKENTGDFSLDSIAAALEEATKVNLEDFLDLPPEDIKDYLKARKFMPVHLNSLAEIILETAKSTEDINPKKSYACYQRTIDLYSLMDETTQSISLDRFQKESWIKDRMERLNEQF